MRERLRAAIVSGIIGHMARCTAPKEGHRSASAAAACPACRGRYGRSSGYSSYGSYSSPSYSSPESSGGGRSSSGGSGSSARPRWSPAGSSVVYTPTEVLALTPVRNSVENLAKLPALRESSYATRGTTGREPPRSFTICWSHGVCGSGSARRTLASACRCSAPSTRAWRTRESGSCW